MRAGFDDWGGGIGGGVVVGVGAEERVWLWRLGRQGSERREGSCRHCLVAGGGDEEEGGAGLRV